MFGLTEHVMRVYAHGSFMLTLLTDRQLDHIGCDCEVGAIGEAAF